MEFIVPPVNVVNCILDRQIVLLEPVKENNQQHKRLARPEKSAVTEQSFTQDNVIQFTKILSTKSDYVDHLIMEVIKL